MRCRSWDDHPVPGDIDPARLLPGVSDRAAVVPTPGGRAKTGSALLEQLQNMFQTPRVSTTSEFERRLRRASLRVTRPRVAVLAALHERPHADTDTIIGAVRAEFGEVSHQAVYDVLRALTAAGLVRRIQPKGSNARYES